MGVQRVRYDWATFTDSLTHCVHTCNAIKPHINEVIHSFIQKLFIELQTLNFFKCILCIGMLKLIAWSDDVQSLSILWLFVTPLTVALQVRLLKGFPRQEDWSMLPFPSSGDLSEQTPCSCVSCTGRLILYHWATWEALLSFTHAAKCFTHIFFHWSL